MKNTIFSLICLTFLTCFSLNAYSGGLDGVGENLGGGIERQYHYTCFYWDGSTPYTVIFTGTTVLADIPAIRNLCLNSGGTNLLYGSAPL